MIKKSENINYHIGYWICIILVLTLIFGMKWGNKTTAFYFVSMLLPIVLGSSYFFNYVLVRKYYIKKRYQKFALYTIYLAIVSLYLEMIVLLFSFVYLENLSFKSLNPHATDIMLLAVVLYLLVFLGSFLLMINQIKENRQVIQQLLDEKEKMKKPFLEIISNRKITKIAYDDIIFIESLSDYIKVITVKDVIVSKEKISALSFRLPEMFLRIHRSFIINTERIKERSFDEILVDEVRLNIGRSYRKEVKELLNKK